MSVGTVGNLSTRKSIGSQSGELLIIPVTTSNIMALVAMTKNRRSTKMKVNCTVCGEQIENEPHLEIEALGFIFHTCNQNKDGNTCYQEWLQRPKDGSRTDWLSSSAVEEGMGCK